MTEQIKIDKKINRIEDIGNQKRAIEFRFDKYPDLLIFLMNSDPEFSWEKELENVLWITSSIVSASNDIFIKYWWWEKLLPLFGIDKDFSKVSQSWEFLFWWNRGGRYSFDVWNNVRKRERITVPSIRVEEREVYLVFNRTNKWKESEEFKWSSVFYTHVFDLFRQAFSETINHFFKREIKESSNNERLFFVIDFDCINKEINKESDIDILISSPFKKERICMEVSRVAFPPVFYEKGKKKSRQDILKLLHSQAKRANEEYELEKQEKNFEESRFRFVSGKIKENQEVGRIKNILITNETDTSLEWSLGNFSTSDHLEELVKSIIKSIDYKNKKIKNSYSNSESKKVLWIISPLPFAIMLKDKKNEKFIQNREVQKLFLQWVLLKKVKDALKTSKIDFSFKFLIITFNETPMVHDGKVSGDYLYVTSNVKDVESPSFGWIRAEGPRIGNLYVKIKNSREIDDTDIDEQLKKYAIKINKGGCDVDSIYIFNITPFTQIMPI